MISRARAEASRNNGRKSRGPRTAAGRSCASHNALRHGLAALTYKPAAFAEVERMAKAICNGNTDPLLFEQALVIAENEMVRRCVRAEVIAMIERLRDITLKPLSRDNSLARAKARFGQAKLRYRQLVQAKAKKIATTTGNEKIRCRNIRARQLNLNPQECKSRSNHEMSSMPCALPCRTSTGWGATSGGRGHAKSERFVSS